ncbi:CubicO group peptidase, beta-lactamase class C family [Microlunatus sagamiharensis]|uniref:CubicO group peptidase, beta-lactamase class C family n=1 Tax=Microlunatus sagamiharensis TaxID=546874 RepID=A0A1H2LLD8_9ACTN|nr:serine hydrolase domain-containing protein [Microlunatus sagamiharensis]SDU81458.1 CubicO group peptidase, beta-lactamase class C family [Microlunatus sagamiharensis]
MSATRADLDVHGGVAEGWGTVADAFRANFADPGEDGAGVAVHHGGRLVVDLVAGTDRVRDRPMAPDALMAVASCSKGVTATVLAMLVQEGAIDPDALVSTYWPEYGVAGKEATTVGMVASHTAGRPYPPLGSGLHGLDLHRGPAVTDLLASGTPWWTPGTAMAYHPVTYGTLLDAVVTGATGRTISQHVRARIAEPLGVEVWMGLPAELDDRVVPGRWEATSPMEPDQGPPPEPGTYADLRARALRENPPMAPDPDDAAAVRADHAAERPAAGAITDARALATMYAATLAPVDGVRLYDDATRARVTAPRTDDVETLIESGTAGPDIRFGLGYQLSSPSMPGFTPASYGHTGAGARLGLADPELGVGFGYVCSLMRDIGPSGDPRWASLVGAVRSVVG